MKINDMQTSAAIYLNKNAPKIKPKNLILDEHEFPSQKMSISECDEADMLKHVDAKIMIGGRSFEINEENIAKSEFYNGFYQIYYNNGFFESLSNKYMDFYRDIKANYTGDDLTKRLQWLDEMYDRRIETMASGSAIVVAGTIGAYFHHMENIITYTMGPSAKGTYVNQENRKFAVSLHNDIYDSLKIMGERAKRYMLAGNSIPSTDEEKEAFNQYISQDDNENPCKYSYRDIKNILSIVDKYKNHNFSSFSKEELQNIEELITILKDSEGRSDRLEKLILEIWKNGISDYLISTKQTKTNVDKELLDSLFEQKLDLMVSKKTRQNGMTDEEKYQDYVRSVILNNKLDIQIENEIKNKSTN